MNARKLALSLIGLLILLIPVLDRNIYHIYVLDRALIHSVVALGLITLTGLAGQISLGHAAFYGIGAYTSALLTLRLGLPVGLGLVGGFLLCALVGIILSIPSFKVSGFFLSLVTIAFGQIVLMIIINWQNLTGGPYGLLNIPAIHLGGAKVGRVGFYYVALAVFALCYLMVRLIINSYVGRAFMAMRDDEMAAETSGINTKYYKALAFSLSAAFGGLAGGLYAHLATFLSPESFVFFESANFVAMSIVGGLRSLLGSLVGGVVVTSLPEVFKFKNWEIYYMIGSSLIVMLIVVLLPNGLTPTLERLFDRVFSASPRPTRGKQARV